MNDIPYLLRGVHQIGTTSSALVSSSPYLNHPRLREWLALVLLRRNGPDLPPPAEMFDFPQILREIRDHGAISRSTCFPGASRNPRSTISSGATCRRMTSSTSWPAPAMTTWAN